MSTAVTIEPPAAPAPDHGPGTWHLTWHGVRTVAVLELRQRVRSTRWVVALVVWFVVVGLITALSWGALGELFGANRSPGSPPPGPVLFAVIVFFVLFLGLLVAPTLSATSINGDRAAGTLAILQVTLLSPAEIVLGKLLAAWAAALAFLAASVPFLALSMAAGGTPVLAMFVCLGVLALLLVAVCAIGLGFSALTARTSGSAVLTYIAVASLTVLSPIVFALTLSSTVEQHTVRTWEVVEDYTNENTDGQRTCEWNNRIQEDPQTQRTWWLLGINPFVVVADAAPQPSAARAGEAASYNDPLSAIRYGVRYLRAGPADEVDHCWSSPEGSPVAPRSLDSTPVWPWGLGANLLLGVAGVWVAVHRLRVPQRTLAKGTRVA